MDKGSFTRRALRWGLAAACLAWPASASASNSPSTSTAGCTPPPVLTQPLLSYGDSGWYFLAPGQTVDNFAGDGWLLSGGAQIVSTTLADGAQGQVLDLPSGGIAVSPPVCLTSDYPSARAMERNMTGRSPGVQMYVTYAGSQQLASGAINNNSSRARAWDLSQSTPLHATNLTGWQQAQIMFVGGGYAGSDSQLYNFWIDPRLHR